MSFNLLDDNVPPLAQIANAVADPIDVSSTVEVMKSDAEVEHPRAASEDDPRENADGPPPDPLPAMTTAETGTLPGDQSNEIEEDHEDDKNEDEDEDDQDDWDEISKGRYFGSGDVSTGSGAQLCHNCKQSGHKRKDCPHQLCRSCGALDDHDTMRCPMTQRCYNCSRLGHQASKCPEPQRQQGSYCRECGSRAHLDRSCPQIWRLYLPSPAFDAEGDWDVDAWCYNCADMGHYGDDCPRPRRTRVIEQSAFCQANEPESRRSRSQRHSQERRESARHQRLDEEELDEDWFARQRAMKSRNPHKHESNRNSFESGNAEGYGYPAPSTSSGPRRSRHEKRFDPYARPQQSKAPIITSERYPRGLPSRGPGKETTSQFRGGGAQKRQPVPAVQRLQNQNRRTPTRGGKAYRGGGRR